MAFGDPSVQPASGGGGGGSGSSHPFAISGPLTVGDSVYETAAGGTVARAKADNVATMPAIGVVTAIVGAVATVLLSGVAPGFSGLSPGATYYTSASTAGAIVKPGDAGFPAAIGEVVQKIGIATSATVLDVDPDDQTVL